tara:strand:+ start:575 stop:775 length:201 start_codon:yes stop_codon:yes gene_type:complete
LNFKTIFLICFKLTLSITKIFIKPILRSLKEIFFSEAIRFKVFKVTRLKVFVDVFFKVKKLKELPL